MDKDYVSLLTVKDLADKWRCGERTIREYVADGTISPCKKVPGVKFHPAYIAECEGTVIKRFDSTERKRMQNEIDELKDIVRMQNELLRKMAILGTESMGILQKIV